MKIAKKKIAKKKAAKKAARKPAATKRTVPLPQTRVMKLVGELRTRMVGAPWDELIGDADPFPVLDELEQLLKDTDLREWKPDPTKRASKSGGKKPIRP